MESSPSSESAAADPERTDGRSIPEAVDWIVGALLVLVGLASVLGGAALVYAIDRPAIREAVANEEIQSDVLSDAELVDVTQATATWSAAGLVATGAILLVAGLAYVAVRRRAHRRAAADEPASHFGANAVLGAVVTAVLSFLPFSPVLGGIAAGYLEHDTSERVTTVGALSGVLAAIPVLVLSAFASGGVVEGLLGVGEGELALVVAAALLLTLGVVVAVVAGLGAIGGFLGGKLATRERADERGTADSTT